MNIGFKNDDPIKRLEQSQESFKEFQNLGLTKFLKRFIVPLTWIFAGKTLSKMISPVGLFGIYSSWIGGRDYNLFGKAVSKINCIFAVHDLTPLLPVLVSTFSHADRLELTVGANPQDFPNKKILNQLLHDYLPEEIERLKALCEIEFE